MDSGSNEGGPPFPLRDDEDEEDEDEDDPTSSS
jgi:hypothetical protein